MAIVWIVLAQFLCVHLISGEILNVALHKSVNVSSRHGGRDPNIAVDGNTDATDPDGVMHTALNQPNAWWTVDLQIQVQDATVKLYFRTDYTVRRRGVELHTSDTAFSSYPDGRLCYRVPVFPGNDPIPNIITVNCTGKWRYLMVYTDTDTGDGGPILDFGEVEVLGCNGTYGLNCDMECGQCDVSPLFCDRYTGRCPTGGCKAGSFGGSCKQVCIDSYGPNCVKSCDARHCEERSSSCDIYYGLCSSHGCAQGWMGRDCTQSCMNGTYGPNCHKSCDSRHCIEPSLCNIYSGQCSDSGCSPGWMGGDCTQVCYSSYGANCSKSCSSRHCVIMTSFCHHVTGACPQAMCKPGYMDTDCSQECQPGSYGQKCSHSCNSRHCVTPSATCNHETGVCPGGCKAGWKGTDCTNVCISGTYGANCTQLCNERKCKPSPFSCDSKIGECPDGCVDGWQGIDCTIQCPVGTFGRSCTPCSARHCKTDTGCPADGKCTGDCQEGWTHDTCTQACPSGTYGPGCNFTCGNCTGEGICDHVTGDCPGDCNPGWQGSQCKQSCEINMYGINCKQSCGQCVGACDVVDGHCPKGCVEGYNGTTCQRKLPIMEPQKESVVIPAVVGTLAGLVIVITVMVVFIVYKRRQSTSSKYDKSKDTVGPSTIVSDGGNVYANIAVVEEKAAEEMKPAVHEKTRVPEKPPTCEKPKLILPDKQLQSNPDTEEEIPDEVDQSSNRDYYNDSAVVSHNIPVAELEATVQKIKCSKGGFAAEFDRLPLGFTAPYTDSQKPENAGKNKFRGYYPYDHNRVRLSIIPDIPGSDYINASLMHSYDQKKTYIAAQAPNKKTVGDFWRMIWEHRCSRVIMLTGLVEAAKVKCYQYWPDQGPLETDQFQVEVEKADVRANYTVRHLTVTSKDKGDCRTIVQYHYTSWPDHDVPNTLALVKFIWMIRQTDTMTDRPLLVHCSAGIGRTGTYIAVDSLLDQARVEGMVDVLGYVSIMRGQRKNMIQTKEQYECVFQCLVEMTKFGNTSMDVENFSNSYSSRGMDSIMDRKTIREITQMTVKETRNDSPSKHQMWVDGNQNFIVRVGPSLRHVRGYLQAVTPTPGDVKVLWKLVEERNVHNVFAFTPLKVEVTGEKGSKKTYGAISVTSTSQTNLTPNLTVATLQLTMNDDENSQDINLFMSSRSPTMDTVSSLLLDHAHLQHLSTELSPVVLIHGEPDRKWAVMFCIMGNILSGITEDSRVDVIGHARAFLKCCPDLAFTEQDFETLFQFAQKYVETTGSSNTYANL